MHFRGPRRRREKEGAGNIPEDIIAENFPNLGKKTDIQVQGAQRVLNKMNWKRSPPRHTVIKMANIKEKEKILKAARVKQLVTCK